MLRVTIVASGMFLLASTIGTSAGGIGFGIVIGPGFNSVAPPREYQPRVRSYHEEASRPRHQQRQHANDDEKAEAAAPAKRQANENSSIAVLTGKPDKADLHRENSSIASAPRPAVPEQSAIVAVEDGSPVRQAATSHPLLCSRYFPNPGQTLQVPCE
jgi:hypothetical protein